MLNWIIVAARFGQYGAASILFGASLVFVYASDPKAPETPPWRADWSRRMLQIASVVALGSSFAWLMAQTASLTGESGDAVRWSVLWSVLSGTRFGKIAGLRLVLLAVTATGAFTVSSPRMLWILEVVFGAGVLGSYAWAGHGAMNEGLAGWLHLGSDVLHLLAAGLWIGALVALGVLIQRSLAAPSTGGARPITASLDRFSGIGPAVISILILTGCVNSWYLIGPAHWFALLTTAYGRTLLVKLGLFALMLVLAARNRWQLSPRLQAALATPAPLRQPLLALRASVVIESVLGLLVLAVVALLGILEPPV